MLTLTESAINILVVDDVPDNLRLLTKILESRGYNVRKALNGRIALQGAHRDPPSLILLDINMPEMNGYEVCQQLKASGQTSNIPVIFISALDQVDDKVRAFEIGGQDYITKPFQELEVLARIKNQLLLQKQHQHIFQQNQRLEQEIQERQNVEAEVRQLNTELEQRVQSRTAELQKSLEFEATLKRISDRVRDSLDQHKILQSVVEELATILEVHCCDTVLYSSDHCSSVIRYQYVASGQPSSQGQILSMAEVPEIYNQLQHLRSHFAFCQIQPLPIRNHSATLACPIFDNRVDEVGVLGDLWLFKETGASFSEMEINLVQQVANQCAIALRQARLYEAAQTQVQELQRLNDLKDDFLSTISHELRTPIASIKMIIKVLAMLTEQEQKLVKMDTQCSIPEHQVVQYLDMLNQECDRELSLIENLLRLQHLEAGTYAQHPVEISIQDLILHIIEPFQLRMQNQDQTLDVNLGSDLPTMSLDPFSMNQIITELLSNACKYTPAGESIRIAAEVVPDSTATHSLQLSVANTGTHIAPEEIPRIFDKFYRIPSHDPWQHGGTGLGLALVKRLVEQMGGTIAVESTENQTCFTVQLEML